MEALFMNSYYLPATNNKLCTNIAALTLRTAPVDAVIDSGSVRNTQVDPASTSTALQVQIVALLNNLPYPIFHDYNQTQPIHSTPTLHTTPNQI